eukprot:2992188-Ditylum_brightwellii.AAC.1
MLPPKKSPYFYQSEATYFQLADALHTHLSEVKTNPINQAPKTDVIFSLKRHHPDGFLVLKSIIFDLSSHLGGKGADE